MKKNGIIIKALFIFFAASLSLFLVFHPAFAQSYKNQEKIPMFEPTDCFDEYMKQIIMFGFAVIGILALFMLVIGAFQYLMAAGNIGKADSAKETIGSAVFGLLLGLCAWIILNKINPDLVKLELPSGFSCSGGTGGGGAPGGGGTPNPFPSPPPGPGAGKCVEGTGNCAPENLSCFGDQAKNASIVCNAESGGSAGVGSGVDKCGNSSASWGVMQINISCHNIGSLNCQDAFTCCYGNKGCDRSTCQVKNAELFQQCVRAASDPAQNIQKACEIYAQSGFRPWGAARKCKII
jgi:hypothetical protein